MLNENINGVINIDKPSGITSHDVVYRVRRILSIKKVGHTGTLDPAATGVLPVCVGRATKAADMLTATSKGYRAVIQLGITTDTQDATGTVLEVRPVTVTPVDINEVIHSFIGEIEQVPPMYSAVSVGGKRLYELARAGVAVERQARKVKIDQIEILSIEGDRIDIQVECSKGTYIRTLCADIGNALGCGAHMAELRRTRAGRFSVENAVTLERLAEVCKADQLDSVLMPLDALFAEYPKRTVMGANEKRVRNGVPLRLTDAGLAEGRMYRIYAENGEFLCLSRFEGGVMAMEKGFF